MKTLFVSSTFQDMQSERDAIRDIVLPRLNAEAQKYGQSVAVCDLRWGINTQNLEEASANRRVLDICLDEIDRSTSPMIVILGDRYGWIPPENLIRSAAGQRQLRLEKPEISVTALEIEYGMQVHRDNVFFYFRELQGEVPSRKYLPEDPDHRQKLDALKSKIIRTARSRSHTFRVRFDGEKPREEDIQHFADIVYRDALRVLRPQWEACRRDLSTEQAEQEQHWAYIREKGGSCLARMDQVRMLLEEIHGGERSIAIKGRPGSGKSTLLGKLALILAEEHITVIPVVCGLTEETSTAMGVLRQLVDRLELELHLPHTMDEAERDPKAWQKRLNELCAAFEQRGQKLMILVDAVDQLMRNEDRDQMIFLPSSGGVYTVITCLPDIVCRVNREIALPPVGETDKRAVVRRMLEEHHRELPDNVTAALLDKEASDSPLYLSLMLQRLMMMGKEDFDVINRRGGSMKEISQYQIDMIRSAPDSLEQMSAELMRTAGEKIGRELVQQINEYIALSRYGLREEDLALLLGEKWNYLVFRQMINYMRESYMRREDGRYDFTHQSIRRGILRVCKDQQKRHFEIWSALHKLNRHDPIRSSEIIYHCMMAKKYNSKKYFLSYICSSDVDVLKSAANCVYTVSMLDGGEWISSLFENGEQYGKSQGLVRLIEFFNQYCYGLFSIRPAECGIKFRILIQESRLMERLAAAGGDIAVLQMEVYKCCIFAAKFADKNSMEIFREKYLSVGKKLYRNGMLDDRKMWGVYSAAVSVSRGESNEKSLRRGAEIAEEALNSGLLEKLLDGNIENLGGTDSLFACLGETYARLGEYDKSLEANKKNLALWTEFTEKQPLAWARDYFGVGGAYYNVGNSLYALQRFTEACTYYAKAAELMEKYRGEAEKRSPKILIWQAEYHLYLNYSGALYIVGSGLDRLALVKDALEYRVKAIQLCKRFCMETGDPLGGFADFINKFGEMVRYLITKDPDNREKHLSKMCEVFDDFLTLDEGYFQMEPSDENMKRLINDYFGIFIVLDPISNIDGIRQQYQDRCQRMFSPYFDHKIKTAEKGIGPMRDFAAAQAYHNKSVIFALFNQKSFLQEALDAAVTASRLFAQLEQFEISDPCAFQAMEATVFCHTGKCFTRTGDNANALRYFSAAVDRQTRSIELSDSKEGQELLTKYKEAYETAKRSVVYAPQREPAAASKPRRTEPQPKQQYTTLQHGYGEIACPGRIVYRGAWKEVAVTAQPESGAHSESGSQQRRKLKHGYGEITYPSGASYHGEWKEDQMCGYGIRTDIYGKKSCGQWQDGILVKAMPEFVTKWKLNSIKSKAEKS